MKHVLLALAVLAANLPASAQLFPIETAGKAGYIDASGRIVIKPRFDEARYFHEGLAPVRVDEDWGYIDASGKMVIKPQFFQASGFSDGIASVGVWFPGKQVIKSQVGFYSYINKSGQLITKDRFGVAFSFSDGLAQVLTEDYKHGLIDQNGKILFFFDIYGTGFSDGLAMFKTHGNMPDTRVGYVDKTGKIVIPPTYTDGEDFSEGLACVYSNDGAGYIDTTGKIAIDFRYTYCRQFSEGLAAVFVNGKYGYIDRTGKMVIQPQFADAEPFSDGVAVVRVAENLRPLEREKRVITPERNIIAFKDGLFGAIDKTGKSVVRPEFTQLGSFSDGLAWVNLSDSYLVHGQTDRWGYINKQGKIVWKSF